MFTKWPALTEVCALQLLLVMVDINKCDYFSLKTQFSECFFLPSLCCFPLQQSPVMLIDTRALHVSEWRPLASFSSHATQFQRTLKNCRISNYTLQHYEVCRPTQSMHYPINLCRTVNGTLVAVDFYSRTAPLAPSFSRSFPLKLSHFLFHSFLSHLSPFHYQCESGVPPREICNLKYCVHFLLTTFLKQFKNCSTTGYTIVQVIVFGWGSSQMRHLHYASVSLDNKQSMKICSVVAKPCRPTSVCLHGYTVATT